MKNSKLLMITATMFLGSFSLETQAANQRSEVPAEVNTAFAAKYPQGKLKAWKILKTGYEAVFKMDHQKSIALYDANGVWIKTEISINASKMPRSLKTAFRKSKYASYYIDELTEVITNDTDFYRLKIDNHGGSSIPTEGYGGWEDDQLDYTTSGTLINTLVL